MKNGIRLTMRELGKQGRKQKRLGRETCFNVGASAWWGVETLFSVAFFKDISSEKLEE